MHSQITGKSGCCILPHDNGQQVKRDVHAEGLERKTCGRSRALESSGCSLAMPRTIAHGRPGHARFNVPNVPGLRDRSAVVIGNLDELDSAVVMCLCDPHGIQVWI